MRVIDFLHFYLVTRVKCIHTFLVRSTAVMRHLEVPSQEINEPSYNTIVSSQSPRKSIKLPKINRSNDIILHCNDMSFDPTKNMDLEKAFGYQSIRNDDKSDFHETSRNPYHNDPKFYDLWGRHTERQQERTLFLNEPKKHEKGYIPYYLVETWRRIPIVDPNNGEIKPEIKGNVLAEVGKPKIRNLREENGQYAHLNSLSNSNNKFSKINQELDEFEEQEYAMKKLKKGTISWNAKKKMKIHKVPKYRLPSGDQIGTMPKRR